MNPQQELIEEYYQKLLDELKQSQAVLFGEPINFDDPHAVAVAMWAKAQAEGNARRAKEFNLFCR